MKSIRNLLVAGTFLAAVTPGYGQPVITISPGSWPQR